MNPADYEYYHNRTLLQMATNKANELGWTWDDLSPNGKAFLMRRAADYLLLKATGQSVEGFIWEQ